MFPHFSMAWFPAADWKRSPRSERRDENQVNSSWICQRLSCIEKISILHWLRFIWAQVLKQFGETSLVSQFLLIGSRLSSHDHFSIVYLMFFSWCFIFKIMQIWFLRCSEIMFWNILKTEGMTFVGGFIACFFFIWKPNIALFENQILPYLKPQYCLIWTP